MSGANHAEKGAQDLKLSGSPSRPRACVAEGFQRLSRAGPPMAAFRKMGEKLGIVEKPDPLEQVGVRGSLASFEPLTATRARARALVERTRAPTPALCALAGEGVEEADQKGDPRDGARDQPAHSGREENSEGDPGDREERVRRAVRARRSRPCAFGLTRLRTRRYAGEAVKVLAREIVRTRRCKEKMCVGVRSRAAPPDRARSLTCERSKVHGPRGAQLDVDAADDSGRHRQSCRLHAEVDRGARAGGVSACGREGAASVTILRARHARRR